MTTPGENMRKTLVGTTHILSLNSVSSIIYTSAMNDSIEKTSTAIRQFSELRDWTQFHTPRNLALSLMAEVGELAELLQWKSENDVKDYVSSTEGQQRLSEEIADIAIYIIRLCQVTEIDFLDSIERKLEINEKKYPLEFSKGNARKYTERN